MFYCKRYHLFLIITSNKQQLFGYLKVCFFIFLDGQQSFVLGVAYALEDVQQIGETDVPDKDNFVGLPGDDTALWRVAGW
jgi:hypothetical protein